MRLSLRRRILLTLTPLLLLLALLGGVGAILLERLGNRINAIMRENYDSVRAMEQLNEAVERIDSSFQFALAGKEASAREKNPCHAAGALTHGRFETALDAHHPCRDGICRRDDPMFVHRGGQPCAGSRECGEGARCRADDPPIHADQERTETGRNPDQKEVLEGPGRD